MFLNESTGYQLNQECVICKSETTIIEHPLFGRFHSCSHCEFISKNPNDTISSKEEFKIYNTHQNSYDDPRYIQFFQTFLDDAVFPFVSEGKVALDFGSGPTPVLSRMLKETYHYQVDLYDLYYQPNPVYIDKQYDLITTTEVVEHIHHPMQTFELFKELLKPEGILAVMTLFHQHDKDHFLNWHYIRDRSHVSFYTPKTMEVIAECTGLKVIHTNNHRFTTFKAK